jgi:tetratricopeptide (TPR) repeat protein
MSKSPAFKTSNLSEHTKTAPHMHSGAPPNQFTSFEAAMKLFHARQFQEARDLFAQAMRGPERDVANRAQLHAAMCDRRLQQATVNLRSPEDYYNYGVALINLRKLAEARAHLEKALEMSPAADHVHYALALAQALAGDVANAQQNLKRAIELEPRNRLIARQDADFAPLANQPPFDALIYPEKKSW